MIKGTFESFNTLVQSTYTNYAFMMKRNAIPLKRKVSPPFNLANILLGNVICSAIRFINVIITLAVIFKPGRKAEW